MREAAQSPQHTDVSHQVRTHRNRGDGNCERCDYLLSDMAAERSLENHHYNDKGEFVMNVYREYPLIHYRDLVHEADVLGER
jgi:hypothetical protein